MKVRGKLKCKRGSMKNIFLPFFFAYNLRLSRHRLGRVFVRPGEQSDRVCSPFFSPPLHFVGKLARSKCYPPSPGFPNR